MTSHFNLRTHLTPSPLCSPITTCTTYLYRSRFSSEIAIYFEQHDTRYGANSSPFNFAVIVSPIFSVHTLHCSCVYCLSLRLSMRTSCISFSTTWGRNLTRCTLRETLTSYGPAIEDRSGLTFAQTAVGSCSCCPPFCCSVSVGYKGSHTHITSRDHCN